MVFWMMQSGGFAGIMWQQKAVRTSIYNATRKTYVEWVFARGVMVCSRKRRKRDYGAVITSMPFLTMWFCSFII